LGDKTYNTRKIIAKDTSDELKDFIRSFPRQALHAYKIGFKLPNSEDYVVFESKIPKDFKELITTLEKFNIS
jgi:Pseudouridylate synthases, 23S RNA-specific